MTEILRQVEGCPFCISSKDSRVPFDEEFPFDEHEDLAIKPDLGMLMPGHLLVITQAHLTSFAQLDRERLSTIDEQLSLYEPALASSFGNYFRIEHGSDNLRAHGSGGCIEHAHIHLIPADEDAGPYIQAQLPWEQLDQYDDLVELRDRPYIYLGRSSMHFVIPDPNLSGQWARRQVAAVRGLEQWDWALFNADDDLRITYEALKSLTLERSSYTK